MKNAVLISVLLLVVYFFIPDANLIGISALLYGIILFLDWLTLNLLQSEFSHLVNLYKKHFWIFKKDESNLIYMVGLSITLILSAFGLYRTIFENFDVLPLLGIPIVFFGFKWLAKSQDK